MECPYSFNNEDRITMKILPPKQIQLVFHPVAKVQDKLSDKLIKDRSRLLTWKENDRAVATFKNLADITNNKSDLTRIVKDWIDASV